VYGTEHTKPRDNRHELVVQAEPLVLPFAEGLVMPDLHAGVATSDGVLGLSAGAGEKYRHSYAPSQGGQHLATRPLG